MPFTTAKYGHHHRKARARLLANSPLCAHCGRREATVADHQPPLSLFADPSEWEGELVPSCKPCSDRQGVEMTRLRALRRRERQGPSRKWV